MMKITEVADWRKEYAKVVAKAWSDPDYKAQLLSNPRTALAEVGFEVPADFEISVIENSPKKKYMVLPVQPAEGEISEEALAGIAGGACCTENNGTST